MSGMQPSFEGFARWCEKQSPDDSYYYEATWHCALAQYHQSLDSEYRHVDRWASAEKYLMERAAEATPHTFGACAQRARKALA